jgi:hypothetical protein
MATTVKYKVQAKNDAGGDRVNVTLQPTEPNQPQVAFAVDRKSEGDYPIGSAVHGVYSAQ